MIIIMLGAPGAGKGTQALRISEKYNLPHVSTGDLFRFNIKNGTELGKKAQGYIDNGELVPDEVTIGMLMDRIHEDDCKTGYILDGFPRNLHQADKLKTALANEGTKVDYAVDIEVPDEVIKKRMGGRRVCENCGASYHTEFHPPKVTDVCDECGGELITRKDDIPETVQNRLDVYHEQTQPLIDFYDKEGIVRVFDGTQDMEKVFDDIVAVLGE